MSRTGFNAGTMMYYTLANRTGAAVQYVIEMKDIVDGEALRQAVDITLKRYPYVAKKIVVEKEGYLLEDNDLPIVVKNTHHTIPLCGPDANYHQIAVTYSDHTIYFINTHSIFDGRGRGPFLHTLMYYYCKIRYNEDVQMDGVNLADSPIDPAEYYDPFDAAIQDPENPIPLKPTPEKAMQLSDMGLVHPSKSHVQTHHISIDEGQLMKKCKENDASPNSAIPLIIARAIANLHPDSKEPIVANIGCDPRSALGAELSHLPLATSISMEFVPEMRDMDFEEQNTIFRSEIILKSDPSSLLVASKAAQQLYAQINALPTLEQKIQMDQAVVDYAFGARTFSVSYSGKSDFGSCDRHIAALFPQLQFKGGGLVVEISATNGKFYLTFTQEWKEDVYFNAFLKELTKLGIDYDLLYSAQLEPIEIDIIQ